MTVERSEAQKEASRENGKKGGRPKIAKQLKTGKSAKPLVPEINRQAYAELSRSASNLNQLAAHLNSVGADARDADSIYAELAAFRAALIGMGGDDSEGK
jgi:hypothetical protein